MARDTVPNMKFIKTIEKKHRNAARVIEINRFIPLAVKEASEKVEELGKDIVSVTGVDGQPANYSHRTKFFHQAMKKMTIAAGIRSE